MAHESELSLKRDELKQHIDMVKEIARRKEESGETYTEDEARSVDEAEVKIQTLKAEVDTLERNERVRSLYQQTSSQSTHRSAPVIKVSRKATYQDKEYAFRAWIAGSNPETRPREEWLRSADLLGIDVRSNEWYRDQTTDVQAEGGYLLNDSTFYSFVDAKLPIGKMEEVCNVIPTVTGGTFHWATLNDTSNKAATSAQATAVDNTGLTLSRTQIDVYSAKSAVFPVAWESIEDTGNGILNLVESACAKRLARAKNEIITVGDGTNKGYGFLEDSTAAKQIRTSSYLGASVDVSEVVEDLYDLYFSVNADYRESDKCVWTMNDTTLKHLIKVLVSSNDERPIWGSGLNGAPGREILDKRVVINPDMPSMLADTERKAIAFGAFDNHWVRLGPPRLVKDNSIYSNQLATGVFAYQRMGCRLMDAGTGPVKHLVSGVLSGD